MSLGSPARQHATRQPREPGPPLTAVRVEEGGERGEIALRLLEEGRVRAILEDLDLGALQAAMDAGGTVGRQLVMLAAEHQARLLDTVQVPEPVPIPEIARAGELVR